jgi:hypothetical protein
MPLSSIWASTTVDGNNTHHNTPINRNKSNPLSVTGSSKRHLFGGRATWKSSFTAIGKDKNGSESDSTEMGTVVSHGMKGGFEERERDLEQGMGIRVTRNVVIEREEV